MSIAAQDKAKPSQQTSVAVRRILMIRFGGIGDILMTTPTLRAVKTHYPNAQVDYLVNRGFRDVLLGHPAVHAILEFKKRGADILPHRFAAFLLSLRFADYDLVINLHPSVKTHLMTWAASPRQALVFRKDQTIQTGSGRRRHAIDDFYKTVEPLGVPGLEDRALDFSVSPAARNTVDGLLCARGYSSGNRLLVLHPAANHRVNRWPATHYLALCDVLTRRQDTLIALTGHRKDAALVRSIRDAVGSPAQCLDLSGLLSLKEFGALLERADAFVTGDTGPMHIASAIGTTTISLFGAADSDRTGPLASSSRVLADRSLPCAPCHARSCRFGKEARCMQRLLPRTVVGEIEDSVRQSWQVGHLDTEAIKQR